MAQIFVSKKENGENSGDISDFPNALEIRNVKQYLKDIVPKNSFWPSSLVTLCSRPLSPSSKSNEISLGELGAVMVHKMLVELGLFAHNYEHDLPAIFTLLLPSWQRIQEFSKEMPKDAYNPSTRMFLIRYKCVEWNEKYYLQQDAKVYDEDQEKGFYDCDAMYKEKDEDPTKNEPFPPITYGESPVKYSEVIVELIMVVNNDNKIMIQGTVDPMNGLNNHIVRHELDIKKYVKLPPQQRGRDDMTLTAKDWSKILEIDGSALSSDFRSQFAYSVLDIIGDYIRFERSRLTEQPPEILSMMFQALDTNSAIAWMLTNSYLYNVALITWRCPVQSRVEIPGPCPSPM